LRVNNRNKLPCGGNFGIRDVIVKKSKKSVFFNPLLITKR